MSTYCNLIGLNRFCQDPAARAVYMTRMHGFYQTLSLALRLRWVGSGARDYSSTAHAIHRPRIFCSRLESLGTRLLLYLYMHVNALRCFALTTTFVLTTAILFPPLESRQFISSTLQQSQDIKLFAEDVHTSRPNRS